MGIRRSSKHTKKKNRGTQTGKRKLTCCQKCKNKIRRCCCKMISKFLKKQIFGTVSPKIDDYEVHGIDLGSIKRKFDEKHTISTVTLFRKFLKPSKLSLKNLDLIEGLSALELKKKYSVTGSKEKVLEKLVDDYKRGKISLSNLTDRSKFDARKLDKDEMKKMITKYEVMQKRIKDNSELDAEVIKKKYSVYGSRAKILDKMVADYKKGKGSATGLSVKSKLDLSKLNKKQISEKMKKYDAAQKDKKRLSFLKKSEMKLRSIIDKIKSVSFTDLPKNLFTT